MTPAPKAKGRRSKLDDRQWAEIGRRLANGESFRKLAKEFGVGASTISERFSERVHKLQVLANTIASAEKEFELLPISEQGTVRSLADQFKSIQTSLASGAARSADTFDELAGLAQARRKDIKREDGSIDQGALMDVANLTMTANKAATPALRLAAVLRGKPEQEDPEHDQPTLSNLSDSELDQFIALQEKAGGH